MSDTRRWETRADGVRSYFGEPTVLWPETPGFYGYLNYHEFFFGPYATLDEARIAYTRQTARDNYFDYDGWMIKHCTRRPADIQDFYDMPEGTPTER